MRRASFKWLGGLAVLAAVALALALPSPALAQCGPFTDAGAECQVSGTVTTAGTFSITKTLHMLANSTIVISPETTGLTLNIDGDFIMDAGSKIDGDVTSGSGATIIINALGDILLKGGNPGAIITSSRAGTCPGGGQHGGDITLTAGGNFTQENGSEVDSIHPCGKGHITISGIIVKIDGIVISKGTTTRGQGGPIDVFASCDLLVGPTGQVVSQGRDPGADRVHLEGGCSVKILGLVASTGPGHAPNLQNLCKAPERPDKPANSTACVEIWSGDTLLIDSNAPNNGEVHADTGNSGGTQGLGWVALIARGDITILGDSVAPFAVHANQTLGNGHGGDIEVKSQGGAYSATGLALQASDTAIGGKGGNIDVQSALGTDLGNSKNEARGANAGGGGQAGGTIEVRSFQSKVIGAAPGTLNADGGVPNKLGAVTITGCNQVAGDYAGAVTPPPGAIVSACPPPDAPTLSAYVVLPVCTCACICANNFRIVEGPAGGDKTFTVRGQGLKQATAAFISLDCNPVGIQGSFVSKTDTQLVVKFTSQNFPSPGSLVIVSPTGSCCMPALP